ncbi:MAG: DNA alkylation repair protein [Bacteroidia bacterium]
MTVQEILSQLESLSDERRRKHNTKNGAGDNQFGVPMGEIRKVAKKLKTNHELALKLWETGNIEARLVAILIIKPKDLSPDKVDQLVRSVGFFQVADWLNAYIVKKHPEKETLRQGWMQANDPMAARAGWSLTAERVERSPEGIDLPGLLDRIVAEMLIADPLVQWTMNNTLVGIGVHHPEYRERALAIGEKLGVYRDYSVPKGCTSPFAPMWINKMVSQQS